MRVYLASQYARREELKSYADQLQSIGIDSTARWLNENADLNGKMSNHTLLENAEIAQRDIEDVDKAEAVLLFTNGSETKIVRGAHHFELGYAYGRGKKVFTVGPRDNVFHYLPCVVNFPTWAEAFAHFQQERAREEAALGY